MTMNETSNSTTGDSKCALCATDDRTTPVIIAGALLVSLLFLFAVYEWCQRCRWRRQRGTRPQSQRRDVPQGNDERNNMSDEDVSIRLRYMRRSQIISCGLVKTKAVTPSARESLTIQHAPTPKDDPLDSTIRTESSSSDVSSECSCGSSCSYNCGDDEEHMQRTSLDVKLEDQIGTVEDDVAPQIEELVQSTTKHTPRTEENAVSLDSSLVLESTGWEVETCAICIEPYKENDVVCHSRKENCTHGKSSLARLLEYRVSLYFIS